MRYTVETIILNATELYLVRDTGLDSTTPNYVGGIYTNAGDANAECARRNG